MSKAIVFNCHYNGLSIIQTLGQQGIPCIAMDAYRSIGTWSRYATFVRCPDPGINETAFVNFLYDYCKQSAAKPVLFPTNDHWATAIAKHKERLAEVALPCVANWEAVRTIIEKDRFYALGQERGYLTPKTWLYHQLDTIDPRDFPIVAKPAYRRNSSDKQQQTFFKAMDRLRLAILPHRAALESFLLKERDWVEHLVFQSYVPGLSDCMHTVGVYANSQHHVTAIFTGKKVRGYPADIGDCIVGEVHQAPEDLIENTQRIINELQLSGILEFEYKRDPNNGRFTLIEINPRSWSWIGITPACGVNLPLIAYQDLTEAEKSVSCVCPSLPNGSVRYAKVLEDALNVWLRYRFDYSAWSRTPWQWWRELKNSARLVSAEFTVKDPWVAVMSVWRVLRLFFGWLLKKGWKGNGSA